MQIDRSSETSSSKGDSGFGFALLSSGSKANCALVSDYQTTFLIDCGLSGKRTSERLLELGFNLNELDALLITHEHSDHTSGLSPLLKKTSLQVHTSEVTAQACKILDSERFTAIPASNCLELGQFKISFFPVHHDAADPVGMIIERNGLKLGYLTDTGHVCSNLELNLTNLDALIIEANHDLGMLEQAFYPDYVKDRIAGPKGHLGNIAAGELLSKMAKRKEPLQHIVAAHISENSNTPELALRTLVDGWADGGGDSRTNFVAGSVEKTTAFLSLLPKLDSIGEEENQANFGF